METKVDILSCCWEMNLLTAFNNGGYWSKRGRDLMAFDGSPVRVSI